MRLATLATLCVALTAAAAAQDGARLATFVDCPGYVPGCDVDFFQTEIGFARFVRDPANAEAYVLVTRQETGGGGTRYTLFVEGRGPLAGARRDTLTATVLPAASDDDQRRALLRRIALGLAGLAGRTPLADRITVAYAAPAADAPPEAAPADPWNSWVFSLDGQGYFSGERRYSQSSLYGSVSARRVTDALKLSIRPSVSYNRSAFEVGDGSTVVSDNASYGLYTLGVVSLSDHWSAGGRANVSRSTFSNVDLKATIAPAVEYNVFPYAEATRRQVRIYYGAGVEAAAYSDTTIFGKTDEVQAVHSGGVATEFAQPWGSVDVYSEARHYLTLPDKYNLSIGGGVELRVVRGLSVRVNGYYSFVRDQINLPAEDPSDSEVLTRQQELATGFTYFASLGLSYSFGSIYNQVVNARFGN